MNGEAMNSFCCQSLIDRQRVFKVHTRLEQIVLLFMIWNAIIIGQTN